MEILISCWLYSKEIFISSARREPDVFSPFGTDASGRDLYSRVLSALRIP